MRPGANRYAVAGAPVRHSLSPWIHAHFARRTQRNAVYAAFAPKDFAAFARDFFAGGGRGLNITAPFKRDALLFAARASAFARRADAANVLALDDSGAVSAYNTDGAGLVRDLTNNCGISLPGRRILLAGAGGAARAAAIALSEQKAKIVVAARKSAAAESLARLVGGESVSLQECGGGYDLVINAIPGAKDGESPLPSAVFAGAKLAYDLNYGRAAAVFLRAAAAAEYRADGGGMLVEQAALSFAIWEGAMPSTAGLIQILRPHPPPFFHSHP